MRRKGFEPLTPGSVDRCSIQLSYRRPRAGRNVCRAHMSVNTRLQENISYNRVLWRRERDSNPRWSYKPHTPLAGERLQPLGHLSAILIVTEPHKVRSIWPQGASAPAISQSLNLSISHSQIRVAPSLFRLAEEEGFEPPVGLPTAVFKTAAFDHSATPPQVGARRKANRSGRGSQEFSTPKVQHKRAKACKITFLGLFPPI